MHANPATAPLSNLTRELGTGGVEVIKYEYYGTPVQVFYDSDDHFFNAASPAFLPFRAMMPVWSIEDMDVDYVDELLRQEAGLFYLPRAHGSVEQTAIKEAFASIYVAEDSGVEIRDLYDETLAYLIGPQNGD